MKPWFMVEVEKWHAMIDNWLNPPCAQCAALHGQEFDRGQGPYPKLHPGCRCSRTFSRIRYTQEEPTP